MNTSKSTMTVLLPGCKTSTEMGCPLLTIIKFETVLIQGGSNTTGTKCGLFTHKSVPVIFEPPCSYTKLNWRQTTEHLYLMSVHLSICLSICHTLFKVFIGVHKYQTLWTITSGFPKITITVICHFSSSHLAGNFHYIKCGNIHLCLLQWKLEYWAMKGCCLLRCYI